MDETDGVMGDDIYDNYIAIKHWGTGDEFPLLSDLTFDEDEIITKIELRDGESIEKEAEGYTGNAGMTMAYWYHYGAVVVWPQKEHFNILSTQDINSKLVWFDYYLNHWNPFEASGIKKILRGMIEDTNDDKFKESVNFDPLVALLIKLDDANLMASTDCQALLVNIFHKISVNQWVELIQSFELSIFEDVLRSVANLKKIKKTRHLTEVLKGLIPNNVSNIEDSVSNQISQLPVYLSDFDLPIKASKQTYSYDGDAKDSLTKQLIINILGLSFIKNNDKEWLESMTFSLTEILTRDYINTILSPVLLAFDNSKKVVLAQLLAKVCKQDLTARVDNKPTPPIDWSREVPKSVSNYQKEVWDMLTPFLTSPTEIVFDYAKQESYRKNLESVIRNVTIDIRMETIRKGSPHTLRLTKTQAAYEKDLKNWHEDFALLQKMDKIYF